jgi:hypothetical protein
MWATLKKQTFVSGWQDLAITAIVYFGIFCFVIIKAHSCSFEPLFGMKRYVLNLTKSGLGHILGDSFHKTSGHPD